MEKFRYFITGFKINKVIQALSYSDILMMSGWGLISPIIAIFFADSKVIIGGDVALAGLAATVYFLVKSILQIPVARWIDVRKGEWDDYLVMATGAMIYVLCAFLYIGVNLPWHVIAVQLLYAVGAALYYPSWLAIFTRHVDHNEEGLEWSLYFTGSDLTSALTAGLGGLIAAQFGYQVLFLIVGVSSLVGSLFLLTIARELKRNSRAKALEATITQNPHDLG